MSRPRNKIPSFRASRNALSDDENEELSNISRSTKSIRLPRNNNLHSNIPQRQSEFSNANHMSPGGDGLGMIASHSLLQSESPSSNTMNHHSMLHSPANLGSAVSSDSLKYDLSSVQYTTVDKFRWIIFKYIYLTIIRLINRDVWIMSKIHCFGKVKSIFILLILLLFYLEFSTFNKQGISSAISNLFQLFEKMQYPSNVTCPNIGIALPSFSITAFFSSLFAKTNENTSYVHESVVETSNADDYSSKNSISTTDEALKRRIANLENKIKEIEIQQSKNEIQKNLQSEIHELKSKCQISNDALQKMEYNLMRIEKFDPEKDFRMLSDDMIEINSKLQNLEQRFLPLEPMKKCCDNKLDLTAVKTLLENHLITAFQNVMYSDTNPNSPYNFFNDWLESKFISNEKLTSELSSLFAKLRAEQSVNNDKSNEKDIKLLESIIHSYMGTLKQDLKFSSSSQLLVDEKQMRRIAKEIVMLYDADKTGLVDYALESAGGSVVGTRCSESYVEKTGKFSVFGLSLWGDHNSPRTAIQPDMQPGKCWAFKGSQGFLVIQLSYTIRPTGFTLEHIPVSISPTGKIDSAPKNFSVWALESEEDHEGRLLGEYSYDDKADPLQYFPVKKIATDPVSYVELKIHSNHGNLDYTCLYRFRVHGTHV